LLAGVWFRAFLVPDAFHRADWVPSALIIWTIIIGTWTGLYISVTSLRRANSLEKQRLQSDLLARDARLAMLRQQLNPHFLFNSLNSIRALIFEDADKASEMVDRLAALLRYSLQSQGGEFVTLAEELLMINEYLSIEKIRFEDRLQVEMSISKDSTQAQLPRMLLQTLVENAVKHGIEPSVSGGIVSVTSHMQDHDLRLTVRNPGVISGGSNSTRLGLKNAEQRLALLTGPRASLKIQRAGSNVEANVLVPQ
jgi:LytS/YehU family sensor histidine kinase